MIIRSQKPTLHLLLQGQGSHYPPVVDPFPHTYARYNSLRRIRLTDFFLRKKTDMGSPVNIPVPANHHWVS